ncbi:hypothetical protein F4813DRAFT_73879 [Daldinia decipiens]|uniref:uncharacterized protein n=1 Tax=Daldinia decipiens TaxID=326647 RepID=UPI0020C335C8|nr:uncharacterized protein F4813DRAFT_73879 [Daldinia decipiens]KAI1657786.1 hypothetical protein F4813DRAFT_73879 [Daldinia decipiens]
MDALPPGIDLCQVPAGTPPDGVPNFLNPPSLGPALIGVTATMMAWTVIFLAGRLWVNRHRFQQADACAILALIISAAYSGNILAMTKYMRHQYDIPACWFNATYVKLTCSMQILMPLSHSLSKASILLLLFQIFSINKRFKIAIYIGLLGIILDYGPNLILGPIYTVPYAGETWEDLLTNGRPQHLNKVGLEQAVLAVVIDLYIFVLPFPMLSSLNLDLRKRLQLVFVFGTALMGVIASVIGLALRVPLLTTEDPTWQQGKVFICIMVEIYVAIIVSCFPAFANFAKAHISGSDFYKSLTSLLWSRRIDKNDDSSPQGTWRMRTTFGGTKPPGTTKKIQRDGIQYYEFHDTVGLNSTWTYTATNEASVVALDERGGQLFDNPDSGITRVYEVDQSFGARGLDLATEQRAQHAQYTV